MSNRRTLSLTAASVTVVANMIGGGIFTTTGLIAGMGASSGDILVAWLIGDRVVATHAVARTDPSAVDQRFRLLIVANALGAFGYVITATFIVALVRGSAQLKPLEASIWVVFGLAAAPSVAVWTWLAARAGIFRAFAFVCLVEAAGVLASVLWLEAAGTIFAAVCVGGSFMGLTALGMMGARALTVGDARRPVALMTASFGCGQMIGPSFAGITHDATGGFLVPSLCAVASLLVASILAWRAGAMRAVR